MTHRKQTHLLQLREHIDGTEDYINIQVTYWKLEQLVSCSGTATECCKLCSLCSCSSIAAVISSFRLVQHLSLVIGIELRPPTGIQFLEDSLLQLELFSLGSGTLCLPVCSLVAGIFGMNLPFSSDENHGYTFEWSNLACPPRQLLAV